MSYALESRLKEKELEVLEAVREHGVKEAMLMFGVKTRSTFMVWLKIHQDGLFMAKPLAGFTGGEKHKWLLMHRETILDLLEIWGEDKIMEEFCLQEETLYNLRMGSSNPHRQTLSRTDRLEITMRQATNEIKGLTNKVEKLETRLAFHNADLSEIRGDNNKIREAYSDFAETTAKRVAEVLIAPLLQHLLPTNDPRLQKPDISIESLLSQAKKSTEGNGELGKTTELEKTTELSPHDSQLKEVYLLAHPLAENKQEGVG